MILFVFKFQIGPIRTRRKRGDIRNGSLEYLKDKLNVENEGRMKALEIEERKLIIEERKLRLEEEKFQLEKREREARLELQMKEQEHNLKIAQQQQHLINFFIERSN